MLFNIKMETSFSFLKLQIKVERLFLDWTTFPFRITFKNGFSEKKNVFDFTLHNNQKKKKKIGTQYQQVVE